MSDIVGGRIAVGVSGSGSNLRALVAAAGRGSLGGEVVLVFADRPCPGLEWAADLGIETILVPGGDDATLAETLLAAAPDVVVLAGYLRLVGPAVLAAFGGRILNVHPSLLPSFPGLHGARDALAAGVAVTGVTVHLVDATLDGGPIVAQEAVPVLPDDDEASLLARIHPVEHRLLPAAVAALLAGALTVADRRPSRPPGHGRRGCARPGPAPRAPLGLDKTGLVDLGRGLVRREWELVSTGGTARALREAGLPVTDVAAVTGFPEMLDGRVKTLHPRVHAGLLADRRRADHREALLAAGIAPFDLVVVNLYPFAAAARRPGISLRRPRGGDRHRRPVDGPRRGQEPRVGGDRDLARAVRGGPGRPRRARRGPAGPALRPRRRGVPPHRRLRRPDRRGAARAAWPRPASTCPPSRACRRRTTRTRRRSRSRWTRSTPSATARTPTSPPRATAARTASRARPRGRSPAASRRSRARRSRTTTSSTPRRPPRSRA